MGEQTVAALQLRVRELEVEVKRARSRAYYAEGAAKAADAKICPMAVGDPHNTCGLAEALADTLALACGRDPTLGPWLEETEAGRRALQHPGGEA